MSDTTTVLAPNGKTYKAHLTGNGRGYVYALDHRVYGTISLGATPAFAPAEPNTFAPVGKWAFILAPGAPVEVEQSSEVSV